PLGGWRRIFPSVAGLAAAGRQLPRRHGSAGPQHRPHRTAAGPVDLLARRALLPDAAAENPGAIMSAGLLDTAGLEIGYADKTVGRDIRLTLRAGEVLCLLGPNGSGKSTLFRTLLGLQKPLAGRIHVQGRPLPAWPARDLARQLAYVPQAVSHELALSAEEMVVLGRAAHLPMFSMPS